MKEKLVLPTLGRASDNIPKHIVLHRNNEGISPTWQTRQRSASDNRHLVTSVTQCRSEVRAKTTGAN
jgi:hypothetical protein